MCQQHDLSVSLAITLFRAANNTFHAYGIVSCPSLAGLQKIASHAVMQAVFCRRGQFDTGFASHAHAYKLDTCCHHDDKTHQKVTSLFRRDLERMRQPAGVLSSEEIARLRHEAEAELEGQRAVAQARKQKMLKVGCPSWQPSGCVI